MYYTYSVQKFLAIEIEHTRYARFLRVDEQDHKSLNLTTLVDGQHKAEVKVFLVEKGKKRHLHTFTVPNLPRQKAGEPRLHLSGRSDGRKNVRLALRVNGSPFSSIDIPIKKQLGGGISSLPLIIGGFLLLLLLLFLLLRSCGGKERAAELSSPPAREEVGAPKAEESLSRSADESLLQEDAVEEDTVEPTETSETIKTAETVQEEEGETESTTADAETQTADAEPEEAQEKAVQPIVLPEKSLVYFEPNSSVLTASAREKLEELAKELNETFRAYAQFDGISLRIRGHCALYGTEQGRIELSRERASVVTEMLLELVDGEARSLLNGRMEIRSLGGREPVTRDEERQQLNRRVEILVEQEF